MKPGLVAVTGAGMGLGLGITQAFRRRGFEVLGLVYEQGHRAAVEQTGARAQVLDVTAPGDFAFPDDLRVLVNNAGIRLLNDCVEHTSVQEFRALMEVNFFGTLQMTQRAVPVLRAGGGGVICNVSSGSLFSAIPFLAAYRASKAAVSALCETLRVEVTPFGIRVVEIMPGPTATAMNLTSALNTVAQAVEHAPYKAMAEKQFELNQQVPDPTSILDAGNAVVDAVLDDDGPMRYGTDELSTAMLDMWRHRPEEEMLRAAVARMTT